MATAKKTGLLTQDDHIAPAQGGDAQGAIRSEVYAELLVRCALKDEKAFAKLYALSSPNLFAVALRITRRWEWAEEVLQETFVKTWIRRGLEHLRVRLEASEAPPSRLYGTTRGAAPDYLLEKPQRGLHGRRLAPEGIASRRTDERAST